MPHTFMHGVSSNIHLLYVGRTQCSLQPRRSLTSHKHRLSRMQFGGPFAICWWESHDDAETCCWACAVLVCFQALRSFLPEALPRLQRCTFSMAPASWPRCGSLPSPTLRVAQDNQRLLLEGISHRKINLKHPFARKNPPSTDHVPALCQITRGIPEGSFHSAPVALGR